MCRRLHLWCGACRSGRAERALSEGAPPWRKAHFAGSAGMIAVAIVVAVLGAGLSAVGVQLQPAGVRDESRDDRLRLKGIGRLTRNPRWLFGLAILSVCAGLQ